VSISGKTETLEIKCHACPNGIALKVTLGIWHDKTKHCAERTAEILGFVLTDKGPACVFHGGSKI
jgi:hypothetical protein